MGEYVMIDLTEAQINFLQAKEPEGTRWPMESRKQIRLRWVFHAGDMYNFMNLIHHYMASIGRIPDIRAEIRIGEETAELQRRLRPSYLSFGYEKSSPLEISLGSN